VRTPPDGTWAPPGWYMLFVLSENNVPSRGHFIRLLDPRNAAADVEWAASGPAIAKDESLICDLP
jgi:hypothetical protein